jgi:hypothetical protein
MAIRLWVPQGVHEEVDLVATGSKIIPYDFFPYKMFYLDVKNLGPDDVKIMVNEESLPKACTLSNNQRRFFDAKSPKYWRISIYSTGTATVRITSTR